MALGDLARSTARTASRSRTSSGDRRRLDRGRRSATTHLPAVARERLRAGAPDARRRRRRPARRRHGRHVMPPSSRLGELDQGGGAEAPSTTRWSKVSVSAMRRDDGEAALARHDPLERCGPTARIALSPGLSIAVKLSTPKRAEARERDRRRRSSRRARGGRRGRRRPAAPLSARQLAQRALVRAAEHRHEQAAVGGDGEADVDRPGGASAGAARPRRRRRRRRRAPGGGATVSASACTSRSIDADLRRSRERRVLLGQQPASASISRVSVYCGTSWLCGHPARDRARCTALSGSSARRSARGRSAGDAAPRRARRPRG